MESGERSNQNPSSKHKPLQGSASRKRTSPDSIKTTSQPARKRSKQNTNKDEVRAEDKPENADEGSKMSKEIQDVLDGIIGPDSELIQPHPPKGTAKQVKGPDDVARPFDTTDMKGIDDYCARNMGATEQMVASYLGLQDTRRLHRFMVTHPVLDAVVRWKTIEGVLPARHKESIMGILVNDTERAKLQEMSIEDLGKEHQLEQPAKGNGKEGLKWDQAGRYYHFAHILLQCLQAIKDMQAMIHAEFDKEQRRARKEIQRQEVHGTRNEPQQGTEKRTTAA